MTPEQEIIKWRDHIPRERILLVVGEAGVGKSFLINKLITPMATFCLTGEKEKDIPSIELAFCVDGTVLFEVDNPKFIMPQEMAKMKRPVVVISYTEHIFDHKKWSPSKGELKTVHIGLPSLDDKLFALASLNPELPDAERMKIAKNARTFSDLWKQLLFPFNPNTNKDTAPRLQSIGEVLTWIKEGKFTPYTELPSYGQEVLYKIVRPLFDAGIKDIRNIRLVSQVDILLGAYCLPEKVMQSLLSIYVCSIDIKERSWSVEMGYRKPVVREQEVVVESIPVEERAPEESAHKKEKKKPEKKVRGVFDFG